MILDNIEGGGFRSVARRLHAPWAGEKKAFLFEASGGITDGKLHERAGSER